HHSDRSDQDQADEHSEREPACVRGEWHGQGAQLKAQHVTGWEKRARGFECHSSVLLCQPTLKVARGFVRGGRDDVDANVGTGQVERSLPGLAPFFDRKNVSELQFAFAGRPGNGRHQLAIDQDKTPTIKLLVKSYLLEVRRDPQSQRDRSLVVE